MILDDENILRKRIKKIVNNPFLILKLFLIENKTNKDFVYYDLKYELELNPILNKIPIKKYGYRWNILASQINIEKCITLPSGTKYVRTLAVIKMDESDQLKIYIYREYDKILELLDPYIPESHRTIYKGNNYISVFF